MNYFFFNWSGKLSAYFQRRLGKMLGNENWIIAGLENTVKNNVAALLYKEKYLIGR